MLVACFLKDVMRGTNYHGRSGVRSDTLHGYAAAINALFVKQHFPIPVQFSDPSNTGALIINNLAAEEDVARQRAPLTNLIMSTLLDMADRTHCNSTENAVANIFAIGRYFGFRVSEYAQTTPHEVDYHEYPSGRRVIKAFIMTDWVFFTHDKRKVDVVCLTHTRLDLVYDQISFRAFKRIAVMVNHCRFERTMHMNVFVLSRMRLPLCSEKYVSIRIISTCHCACVPTLNYLQESILQERKWQKSFKRQ